jgi:hypothetical protein
MPSRSTLLCAPGNDPRGAAEEDQESRQADQSARRAHGCVVSCTPQPWWSTPCTWHIIATARYDNGTPRKATSCTTHCTSSAGSCHQQAEQKEASPWRVQSRAVAAASIRPHAWQTWCGYDAARQGDVVGSGRAYCWRRSAWVSSVRSWASLQAATRARRSGVRAYVVVCIAGLLVPITGARLRQALGQRVPMSQRAERDERIAGH